MASDMEVMSTNDNGTYVEDNPYEVSLFSSFYLEIFFLRKWPFNNFRGIISKLKNVSYQRTETKYCSEEHLWVVQSFSISYATI